VSRHRSLARDQRAVAMTEMVLVLVPLLTLGLSLLELARYSISALMLQRAAGIAVRACAVIKDQPLHCDGNQGRDGQNSGAQDQQITEAARRALEPLSQTTLTLQSAECTTAQGSQGSLDYPGGRDVPTDAASAGPDNVEVVAEYHCAVPLAKALVCRSFDVRRPGQAAFAALRANARHAHQGARYDCEVGKPISWVNGD
jgi:hypothetical protein